MAQATTTLPAWHRIPRHPWPACRIPGGDDAGWHRDPGLIKRIESRVYGAGHPVPAGAATATGNLPDLKQGSRHSW